MRALALCRDRSAFADSDVDSRLHVGGSTRVPELPRACAGGSDKF